MLSETQVERFHRDGFINAGQALSAEEVDRLRDELTRVIDQKDRADVPQPVLLRNLNSNPATQVWQVVNIWQASDPFRQVMKTPKIVEEIGQLTGARALRIWHDQIQYKPATQGGVNFWHQDSPLWPIIRPNTQVSAWIALDDVDEGNGCMSMVPGSHKWGVALEWFQGIAEFDQLPGEYKGNKVEVRLCPVRKGHVHYHHGLTWHGSHANTSNRPRRAIAYHYMTDETYYDATGNHPMKPFVTVKDGAKMADDAFPIVWQRASVTA